MTKRPITAVLLAGLLATTTTIAGAAAAAAPPRFAGTWLVRQVAVDANDQISRTWEPDDPRVLGELLVIRPDGNIDYAAANPCGSVSWKARPKTTLAALVARNVRQSGGTRTHPSLQDYGLALGNPAVLPQSATCHPPAGSKDPVQAWDGDPSWFVLLSDDRLLEGNGVDTVLVMDRVTPATPVVASFACAGASSASEKAICGSQALAGLDRSVAAAWKRALRRQPAKEATLRPEQAAWLRERDACKADADCLETRMRERIEALMQP